MNVVQCLNCGKDIEVADSHAEIYDPIRDPHAFICATCGIKRLHGEGVKYDVGKLQWSLLPFEEMEEVVRVLTKGANKYAKDNWKNVRPTEKYIDAAFRHIVAWIRGERDDVDFGTHHLANAISCLLFLMWFDNNLYTEEEENE
jgi:hypothetical protein